MQARKRSGDAAHHITEHCERMFCETLKAVFLVEKDSGFENSLVMDAQHNTATAGGYKSGTVQIPLRQQQQKATIMKHDLPTPSPSPDARKPYLEIGGMLRDHVEMWDYACDARFTGFVADKEDERALFVFFDKDVMGKDLKPGLMALLELASSKDFDCTQLVICLDRTADGESAEEVSRGLSWAGFELIMLDHWAGEKNCISDRWLFMGMDV
ncbi:uncharacterized protein LTR77_006473 [Saxophila tyrrhenica]|uniref:Ornithine decarboxylase antizyme n=1 Tax=Saxophila tyrrhenica TaxID=1690608 RepID=A0AAV9PBG1_9PEZI|nr:hypothetical protein LTR77_006473 [Saxophila tyrrhenica]